MTVQRLNYKTLKTLVGDAFRYPTDQIFEDSCVVEMDDGTIEQLKAKTFGLVITFYTFEEHGPIENNVISIKTGFRGTLAVQFRSADNHIAVSL